MRKILLIYLLCTFSLFSSCKDSDSEEQAEIIELRAKQIATEISELCSQYNAITNWYKEIDLKSTLIDEIIYTIQIQDVFLKEKERPYLFFVSIEDIKKIKGRYILIAFVSYPVDYRRIIWINLRLSCNAEIIERILKQRPTYSDRYALFATIHKIEKPDLCIRPDIEYDLLAEDNTFAETHPDNIYDYLDLVISGENYNTFIATGKCEALLFAGKDDWIDEPSDYERVLEIFDSNQP